MHKITNDDNLIAFLEYQHIGEIEAPICKLSQENRAVVYAGAIIAVQSIFLWGSLGYEMYYGEPEYIWEARPVIQLYSTCHSLAIIALAIAVAICVVRIYRSERRQSVFFSDDVSPKK